MHVASFNDNSIAFDKSLRRSEIFNLSESVVNDFISIFLDFFDIESVDFVSSSSSSDVFSCDCDMILDVVSFITFVSIKVINFSMSCSSSSCCK